MAFPDFPDFGLCKGPGHLKPVRWKPFGQISVGEYDVPGVVFGVLPRTPILHLKTRGCRLLAQNCSEIARNPSVRKMAQDRTCG